MNKMQVLRMKHAVIIALASWLAMGCAQESDPSLEEEAVETAYIKGVCYHPVAKGDTVRSFATIDQDLALMKAAGMNTIRTYSPIAEVEVLDKIAAAGMKLIVGIGFNQEGFYDLMSGSYLDYVSAYKDHEAILMWELGNEYNYHPEWFEGDVENWYRTLQEATRAIHELDSVHPVATAHGEIPDSMAFAYGAEVDIWGINVYRWDQAGTFMDEWKALTDKPFYYAEVGADSYMRTANQGFEEGPNEGAQAAALDTILDQILTRREDNAGVLIFSFTDGWWKAGNPDIQDVGGWAPNSSGVPYDGAPNEEYWGIVDIDRNAKQAYAIAKQHFTKD